MIDLNVVVSILSLVVSVGGVIATAWAGRGQPKPNRIDFAPASAPGEPGNEEEDDEITPAPGSPLSEPAIYSRLWSLRGSRSPGDTSGVGAPAPAHGDSTDGDSSLVGRLLDWAFPIRVKFRNGQRRVMSVVRKAESYASVLDPVMWITIGFFFDSDFHPALVPLMSELCTPRVKRAIRNSATISWYAKYVASYYGLLRYRSGKRAYVAMNLEKAMWVNDAIRARDPATRLIYLGVLARRLFDYGALNKVLHLLPGQIREAVPSLMEGIVHSRTFVAEDDEDVDAPAIGLPGLPGGVSGGQSKEPVSPAVPVAEVAGCKCHVAPAAEAVAVSKPVAVSAEAGVQTSSVSVTNVRVPESPPGAADRVRHHDKKKANDRNRRYEPEGNFGLKPVKTYPGNIVTFYRGEDGSEFLGNGVLASGRVWSVAHVTDLAASYMIGESLYPFNPDPSLRRISVPAYEDEIVSFTSKHVKTGVSKIRIAPEGARSGDGVFCTYSKDGHLHVANGHVVTTSSTNGRPTYTVATSTVPGASGAPVFVSQDGEPRLLGVHYGSSSNANVVLGVEVADFQ